MKKLFLLFALTVSGMAMGQTFVKRLPYNYFTLISKVVSYQENPHILAHYDEGAYAILDENFEVQKFIPVIEDDKHELCNVYLYDLDSSCTDSKDMIFTQTLFNTDEKFEYVIAVYEGKVAGDEYNPWIRRDYTGLEIKSESGETLSSITFDTPFIYYLRLQFFKMGETIYLAVSGGAEDEGDSRPILVYRIDRESNSLQKVKDMQRLNIMPRMPKRHEMVTVEMDEISNVARKLVVVNAAGQVVDSVIVPAGSKQVQLSASRMSHGLNVIQLKDGTQTSNGYKIMVR